MRATESKWPYRPVHITNDGERCERHLKKLTGMGIIPNEHLQGIQTSICARVKNPITIIEFSPNGECVRNDSNLAIFSFNPVCRLLRSIGSEWYWRNDVIHASLSRGLNKENLFRVLEKQIKESAYINNYTQDAELHLQFVKKEERAYPEYDSPVLGYRNLVFPVFFENSVTAVLLITELCLEEKLNSIARVQHAFFEEHPHCFDEYCEKNRVYKPEKIKRQIFEEHRRWVSQSSNVLNTDQYKMLIKAACTAIDDFELTLAEQISLQRNRYVRKRMERRIKKFREVLPTKEQSSAEKWDALWQNTKERLDELCSDFAIKYIVVFAERDFGKGSVSLLARLSR